MTGYEEFRKDNFVPISDRKTVSVFILILRQTILFKKLVKFLRKNFKMFEVRLRNVPVRNVSGCK